MEVESRYQEALIPITLMVAVLNTQINGKRLDVGAFLSMTMQAFNFDNLTDFMVRTGEHWGSRWYPRLLALNSYENQITRLLLMKIATLPLLSLSPQR